MADISRDQSPALKFMRRVLVREYISNNAGWSWNCRLECGHAKVFRPHSTPSSLYCDACAREEAARG